MNKLNNKKYTEQYYEILENRKKLPANNIKIIKSLYDALNNFDLIMVSASTGSGKSSQLCSQILSYYNMIDEEFGNINIKKQNKKIKIIMSQPRRITSKNIAEYIAKELDVEIGAEVGYKYRYENVSSDDTIILIVTDGLLVQYLYKNMEQYNIVVIDETHTRSPYIDISLYLIKKYLSDSKNKGKTKFILMSATMDIGNFDNYFSNIGVGYINIIGRSFPIKDTFLSENIDIKNIQQIKNKIIEIINSKKNISDVKDILVFLPKNKYISQVKEELLREFDDNFLILELYSGINKDLETLITSGNIWEKYDLKKIIELSGQKKIKNNAKKIILSTNVAETGLTIDGVNVVIDSGAELNSKFDSAKRMKILSTEYISKASAKQRCGRSGRTSPGECIRLYDENKLTNDYPIPPILVDDIYSVVIDLIRITNNTETVKNILLSLLDPVPIENIENTILFINEMKLVNTPLGSVVQQLQIQPEFAITILTAKKYNNVEIFVCVLFICSCLIIKDRFDDFIIDNDEKKKIIFKFANKKGGIYAFKKIYDSLIKNKSLKNNYYDQNKLKKFCKKKNIKYEIMIDSLKTMFKIDKILKEINYDDYDIEIKNNDPIMYCFINGFKMNIIEINNNGKYVTKKIFVDPKSDPLLNNSAKYYVGLTAFEGNIKINTGIPCSF